MRDEMWQLACTGPIRPGRQQLLSHSQQDPAASLQNYHFIRKASQVKCGTKDIITEQWFSTILWPKLR
jgi:hypothetical protein